MDAQYFVILALVLPLRSSLSLAFLIFECHLSVACFCHAKYKSSQSSSYKKNGYCEKGCSAIAYSGTSLVTGPTTVITMINNAIGASGVVSNECKAVVEQYGSTIMDMLSSGPKKICSQIGLCTFDGTRGVSMGIESVVDESRGRSSGLGHAMCSTCEMTVSWMQHQLMQNQTQDSILTYVNELCDRLPSPTGQSGVD